MSKGKERERGKEGKGEVILLGGSRTWSRGLSILRCMGEWEGLESAKARVPPPHSVSTL
jgi:hypothetical protein